MLAELNRALADIRSHRYQANVKIRMHPEDIELLRQRYLGGNARLSTSVLLGLEIVPDETVEKGKPEALVP